MFTKAELREKSDRESGVPEDGTVSMLANWMFGHIELARKETVSIVSDLAGLNEEETRAAVDAVIQISK